MEEQSIRHGGKQGLKSAQNDLLLQALKLKGFSVFVMASPAQHVAAALRAARVQGLLGAGMAWLLLEDVGEGCLLCFELGHSNE